MIGVDQTLVKVYLSHLPNSEPLDDKYFTMRLDRLTTHSWARACSERMGSRGKWRDDSWPKESRWPKKIDLLGKVDLKQLLDHCSMKAAQASTMSAADTACTETEEARQCAVGMLLEEVVTEFAAKMMADAIAEVEAAVRLQAVLRGRFVCGSHDGQVVCKFILLHQELVAQKARRIKAEREVADVRAETRDLVANMHAPEPRRVRRPTSYQNGLHRNVVAQLGENATTTAETAVVASAAGAKAAEASLPVTEPPTPSTPSEPPSPSVAALDVSTPSEPPTPSTPSEPPTPSTP